MWTDRSFRSVAERRAAPARVVAAVRSATPPSPIVDTGNAPFTARPVAVLAQRLRARASAAGVGEELRRVVTERGPPASTAPATPRCSSRSCSTRSTPARTPADALAASPRRCWPHRRQAQPAAVRRRTRSPPPPAATRCSRCRAAGSPPAASSSPASPSTTTPAGRGVPEGSVVRATAAGSTIAPLARRTRMTPTRIGDRCTIEVHLGPDDLADGPAPGRPRRPHRRRRSTCPRSGSTTSGARSSSTTSPGSRSTTRPAGRRDPRAGGGGHRVAHRRHHAAGARLGHVDQDEAPARRAGRRGHPRPTSCPSTSASRSCGRPVPSSRLATRACRSTRWWATSSVTSAASRWRRPHARGLPRRHHRQPRRRRSGPSSSPSWPTRCTPATGCCSAPTS